jgi:hypothetical protein
MAVCLLGANNIALGNLVELLITPYLSGLDGKILDQEGGADCKWVLGLVNGGPRGLVTLSYVWGLEASNELSS